MKTHFSLKLFNLKKKKALVVLGIFLVGFFLSGTAVSAHQAYIVESTPEIGAVLTEAPTEVWARFNEELLSDGSWMKIYDTSGNQIDNDDGGLDLQNPDHDSMLVTMKPLPEGKYIVRWQATLLDGDRTQNEFSFTFGNVQPNEIAVDLSQTNDLPGMILFLGMVAILTILGLSMFFFRRQQKVS